MPQLEGKVALITGAGGGLGRACARLFAREGARVVIADIDEATGRDAAAEIAALGVEADFVRADVSRADEVQAMVRFATDRFGRLDCAVNNAMRGINPTPLADIAVEDWATLMGINMTGVFLGMKYQIEAMLTPRETGGIGGSIVNIGSGSETSAAAGLSWYLAAKQAIYGMTKCAALDYADKGMRINAVAPGPMWTPALRKMAEQDESHVARRSAHVPLGRIAEPEEVAEAVVWLCTPAASFVLGHTLAANGGYTLM